MANLAAIVYPDQPRATVEQVELGVAKFGGKLVQTSLSKEAEAKFQAMLKEVIKSTQEALDPMAPGRPGGP
jgi:hypothetical protein